ncbi:hypothetical protein C0J52_16586 [Blattella germanica]|nr:hypothetical protein C0J52_16586 [Blattella germanica]
MIWAKIVDIKKDEEEPPKRKKSERNKKAKKAAAASTTVTNVPHTRIKSRQGFVLENIELQNATTSGRRKR